MATTYKIHPAIGVARVGTSSSFYIAPESAGGLPTDPVSGQPVTSFRDGDGGNLLRQAQRFRVFAYDDTKPNDPGTEVTAGSGDVAAIEWTVYLANKKACWFQFEQLTGSGMEGDPGYTTNGSTLNPLRNASNPDRQSLIIDPGPQTIGGNNPTFAFLSAYGVFGAATVLPIPISLLGAIELDSNGNLLVLGGSGFSGTTNINPAGSPYEYVLTTYANNDGWFDDVSDGPVTARLILTDGSVVPVDVPAWCLCAPPKFAPQIVNVVTLYDTMYDIAVRMQNYNTDLFSGGQFNAGYLVDFENEVAPILARPNLYQWVAEIPPQGVSQHATITQDSGGNFPFYIMRAPGSTNDNVNLMPRLAGDNPITDQTISKYLTLTQTQYFLIQQWVQGNVLPAGQTRPPLSPGAALDRAALDNCVGGAFCPGIEMTWICRNPTIYSQPFRIRAAPNPQQGKLNPMNGANNDYSTTGLEPGDLIKYMAQPWQADYNECSNQPINPAAGVNDIGATTPYVTFWWWPAQRPFFVYPSDDPNGQQLPWTRGFAQNPDTGTLAMPNLGDMQMVESWQALGFILQREGAAGVQFVEVERRDDVISYWKPPLQPAGGNGGSETPVPTE
jgi:hypothetical protein